MYFFQEFPKWKYHATKEAVVVDNKDEEMALGDGWVQFPVVATESDLALPVDAPAPVSTSDAVDSPADAPTDASDDSAPAAPQKSTSKKAKSSGGDKA